MSTQGCLLYIPSKNMLCTTILVSQLTFFFQNSKKEQNYSPSTMIFSSHSSFSTTFCLKRLLLSLSRIYNQKIPNINQAPNITSAYLKKVLVSFRSERRITVQLRAYCYLLTNTPKELSLVRTAAPTANISPTVSLRVHTTSHLHQPHYFV